MRDAINSVLKKFKRQVSYTVLMTEMAEKIRHLRFFQKYQKVVLVVALIFVVNVLLASLFHSHFMELSWIFYGKSPTVVLSDLLFLEGAIVFAIGTLAASMKPWVSRTSRHKRHKSDIEEGLDNDREKLLKNQVDFWMLMIIIGVILIVASIMIGILFL